MTHQHFFASTTAMFVFRRPGVRLTALRRVTCGDSPHVDFIIRFNQHSKFLETSEAATLVVVRGVVRRDRVKLHPPLSCAWVTWYSAVPPQV